jgi:hypothetical protein
VCGGGGGGAGRQWEGRCMWMCVGVDVRVWGKGVTEAEATR